MNFLPFRSCVVLFGLLLVTLQTSCDSNNIELHTDTFLLGLDTNGYITALKNTDTNMDYHAKEVKSPLLTIVLKDSLIAFPVKMVLDEDEGTISLSYEGDMEIELNY